MRHALLLLALTLPATAMAQDKQYRQLTLTDGRVIKAEVLETVATGLKMRVPQGTTLISFEILMDMVPIDFTEYRTQQDALIYVYAPGYEQKLAAIYGEIDSLKVADESTLPAGVLIGLNDCAGDFTCMEQQLDGRDWMWLVTVAAPQNEADTALIVRGRTSGGTQIEIARTKTDTASDIWHAAHRVIGLIDEGPVPKSVLTKVGESGSNVVPEPQPDPSAGLGWTKNRVYSSSMTPLPGYTALAQGDTGGFGAGLTVGLLGTGAVAGVLAATKVDTPDLLLITAASYYILSVTTNQAFGMKAYERAKKAGVGVSVYTLPGGGATVGIGGRL